MEKGGELFHLVQSFDDRERLLYRRMAGQNLRNGKSVYLSLFNALAGMEVYDELVLVRRLKDPQLVKHLKTHQTRLFDQLTDFLRFHDQFPSIDAQLDAACERVTILQQRGLFVSARRELKKAQALATKHERYLHLLRLADLQRSFAYTENSKNAWGSEEPLVFKDPDHLDRLQNQIHLKLLHAEAIFQRRSGAHNHERIDQLWALVEAHCGQPILERIKEAKANVSDLMMLDAIGVLSLLKGDFDRAYLAYHQMDALWVSDPAFISENVGLYVMSISCFLHACLIKRRWIQFRTLLSNVKTVRFDKESDAFLLEEALLFLEIIYCLNRGEIDKGLEIVPDAERLLGSHRGRMQPSRVIAYCFNICSMYFMKGQYSKANKWLVRIIHMPSRDYRRDVLEFAPIFQLLLFIAMGDRELLSTRMRARQRARKGEPVTMLEAALLDFGKKYINAADGEFLPLVAQFKQNLLDRIEEASMPVSDIGIGECLYWAEATLQGKDPGDIARQQLESR